MNYYEHHLGDFMRDTAHLTMVEECAYRRLLDAYYIRERALPGDLRECCKLARATSKPERDAVAYVLREFFELREDGHHQGRADKEIARFQDKQRKAKASADARWSQSERNANASPNAMRTHSERNADGMHRAPVPRLQTPDTNNPPTPRKRGEGTVHDFPPGFEALWSLYPRKVAKAAAAKAFARLKPDEALQARIVAAVQAQAQSPEWRKDGGAFVPHLATWLNGRRWEDDTSAGSAGDIFAGAV